MQAQLKKITTPRELSGDITVAVISIMVEGRVYRDDVLMELAVGDHFISIRSPSHGWVKQITVTQGQHVAAGDVLCVLSVFDRDDYRPDGDEVNLKTELGDEGRRGEERKGQRKFGQYDKALFDAPAGEKGNSFNQLKENPLTARMKEGVPPKMKASANQNNPAIDHFAEDAASNPELQNKLSQQLQQQLNIQPGPTVTPTPTNRRG